MIFNLFVYNRKGDCLFYDEWNVAKEGRSQKVLAEEQKLMFGLLYSLKVFCTKTSPSGGEGFHFYRTNKHKVHFYETPTGLKFVMTTDADAPSMADELRRIYRDFYVECAVKNPLYKLNEPLNACEGFVNALQEFLFRHPQFSRGLDADASRKLRLL